MVNKVILIGNVGHSPEIRTVEEVKVANLSIACSESYKDKNGEKVTHTEWVKLIAWRGLAEIIEKYVHKGQQLYIEGKLRTTSHDNKDGVKVYTTAVEVSTLTMLGAKKDADAPADAPAQSHAKAKAADVYGSGSGYADSPIQDSQKTWEPDMSKQKTEDDPEDDLPF